MYRIALNMNIDARIGQMATDQGTATQPERRNARTAPATSRQPTRTRIDAGR